MASEPYPKSRQLARGERRYRRKIASAKQWQAIAAAKLTACFICEMDIALRGWDPLYFAMKGPLQLHHLVPRSLGGDDVADNIVALCAQHHRGVTAGQPTMLALLAAALSDAEYAYVISKLGEDGPRRLFGV